MIKDEDKPNIAFEVLEFKQNKQRGEYWAKVKVPEYMVSADLLNKHMEFRYRVNHRIKIQEILFVTSVWSDSKIPKDQKWLLVKQVPYVFFKGGLNEGSTKDSQSTDFSVEDD